VVHEYLPAQFMDVAKTVDGGEPPEPLGRRYIEFVFDANLPVKPAVDDGPTSQSVPMPPSKSTKQENSNDAAIAET